MFNLIDSSNQISKLHKETDQFGLKKGELWKSPNIFHTLSINCKLGTVWITQEGDTKDHLLKSGEVFETLEEGLVVMQSLSDCSCVEIVSY
jgi:hypothetical protein